MQTSVPATLPAEVVSEIRGEVSQQLQERIRAVVAEGSASGARGDAAIIEALDSPAVKQEIEPLVALLVTYASNRWQNVHSKA